MLCLGCMCQAARSVSWSVVWEPETGAAVGKGAKSSLWEHVQGACLLQTQPRPGFSHLAEQGLGSPSHWFLLINKEVRESSAGSSKRKPLTRG